MRGRGWEGQPAGGQIVSAGMEGTVRQSSWGWVTWLIPNQTHFHMRPHVAAYKHTCTCTFLYICITYCMCQGCSRVYLHPPYHSMKWVWWFVEGSGTFVWQILVNIMDLYIRKSLIEGLWRQERAQEGMWGVWQTDFRCLTGKREVWGRNR